MPIWTVFRDVVCGLHNNGGLCSASCYTRQASNAHPNKGAGVRCYDACIQGFRSPDTAVHAPDHAQAITISPAFSRTLVSRAWQPDTELSILCAATLRYRLLSLSPSLQSNRQISDLGTGAHKCAEPDRAGGVGGELLTACRHSTVRFSATPHHRIELIL